MFPIMFSAIRALIAALAPRYYSPGLQRNQRRALMGTATADRIEKCVELNALPPRVWRALTDYREFGEWFRVKLERPFVAGKAARGHILYPGYEHVAMEMLVKEMLPPRRFCFEWHPHAVDSNVDYSNETRTRVEFQLEETPGGTSLVVTESGFEAIPPARRERAYQMNSQGWAIQLTNIKAYLEENP
jgi:uncharacterized protein YndB with AHSA1/START domain